MVRILVVEDEGDLADALATALRRDGYAVDVSGDVAGASSRLAVTEYDLCCLDLGLPDGDGLDLCREVAESSAPTRILVLTARDAVDDRIAGLDAGADDYLAKPFSLDELAARVRALLRRDTRGGARLRVGSLALDAARHIATYDERELHLTVKELALLRFLMLHAGEVHSAESLLEHVWDEHADPFTNTVRVTISNLRRKLAQAGATDAVETVTGRGYRLRREEGEG